MRKTYRNGQNIDLQANGCDGCSPSRINGVLCHETGCQDSWRDSERECRECGCDFRPLERYAAVCDDCIESMVAAEESRTENGEWR